MDRHRLADRKNAEKVPLLTRPTLARRDAPFPMPRSPSKSTHVVHSENKLVAWGGRVRKATPPELSSAAALLDRLFEHPAGNLLVPELQASTLCYAEMISPKTER